MKYYLFVILLSVTSLTQAQPSSSPNPSSFPNHTRMPGAPNTANLGRFGQYQVSMFTGLPDISIPVYTIKTNKLELPIIIKYHPSGIKVTDVASWVGLGWALDGGAPLRRMVMDNGDEIGNGIGYLSHSLPGGAFGYPLNSDESQILIGYTMFGIDGQPDVYSYSLNGKSGNFIFNTDRVTTSTIPYDNVKIIQDIVHSKFDIMNADGTLYRFGVSSNGETSVEYTSISVQGGGISTPISAWMLKEIISADRSDTIKFLYTSRSYETYKDIEDQVSIDDGYDENYGSTWSTKSPTTLNISQYGQEQILKEISFKNGRVLFDTATAVRADFSYLTTLDKIRIQRFDPLSNSYVLLKTAKFYYNYFAANVTQPLYKRLRLDSLKLQDAQTNNIEKYSFGYEVQDLPAYISRSRDFWGYYNGKINADLIPKQYVGRNWWTYYGIFLGSYTDSVGTANRNPDSNYIKAGLLNRITYPTGGHTDFTFEINRYDLSGIPKLGGGVRIRQVTSYDGLTQVPVIKRYKYGTNENGLGVANFILRDYSFATDYAENNNACYAYHRDIMNFGSTPSISITPFDGAPVCYPLVTEYEGKDTSLGKTIFKFQYWADMLFTIASSAKYYKQDYSWKRGNYWRKSF